LSNVIQYGCSAAAGHHRHPADRLLRLMPGRQIKNWAAYHSMRRKKRYSKSKAARIANSLAKRRKRRKK
jgi:hypothetical protein